MPRFTNMVEYFYLQIKSLLLSIFHCLFIIFYRQYRRIQQYQTIRYDRHIELSAMSVQRLSVVPRKILVLDLDETLIHSYFDGSTRAACKPASPPDFILKVTIDRQPCHQSMV
uniref:FCP1 homology domain-containing protein n=1 Tax=Strongyloides stercoralis TaxID=6248 RepID=A0A0K0DSC6_STRER